MTIKLTAVCNSLIEVLVTFMTSRYALGQT